MKKEDVLARIDHTLLRPEATMDDYECLANEAKQCGVPAVCIPPSMVKQMRAWLPEKIHVCTVVGFPSGYSTTESKAWEAKQAILQGASEIDMVINVGAALYSHKMGEDLDVTRQEIQRLREICSGGIILKVIVETCYLDEALKIKLCKLVTECGADYIKTSTGFGKGGATMKDVLLFKEYIGSDVKIKAAGGISTLQQAKEFIDAGCDRLGSSRLVPILKQMGDQEI